MFILAKLVFEHYIPEQLTKGMWFKQRIKDVIYGKVYEYDRLFELNHEPQDMDSYVQANGYPVKPRIMTIEANPDRYSTTLAKAEEIGWWDEGDHVEELRDIELKDINMILSDFDGEIDIDVEPSTITSADGTEEEEIVIPIFYLNKCTLRIPMEEIIDDDDYDDEGDWDDMDDWTHDEPDTDSAGFSENERCINYNPDDYETE